MTSPNCGGLWISWGGWKWLGVKPCIFSEVFAKTYK